MEIEFDPAKNEENARRHGVSLAFGAVVLAARVGESEDRRTDYSEVRIKAFADIEGQWFACVYTMRSEVCSIIFGHPVRPKEVRKWLEMR
ncbi:BrnT family toxin [Rhodopila globiformis]|uniref:BrnT family toxin n=1 Tax=Rhodopila globiformis TaxID=1071 RepID=A0A2S6MU58_RHOGL|nr:BrnT family toxin [Rhodopila globiformis]PPQ25892.1 hypothetical protein CCS01_31470 [Rhodopila globiformis]